MKIGAHVSIVGGIAKAPTRAATIGAECLQAFASSPRMWKAPTIDDDAIAAYRTAAEQEGVGPLFFHAIYLVNLATRDTTLRRRSIDSVVAYLNIAQTIGAEGVVVHVGSHGGNGLEEGIERIVGAIEEILDRSHRLSHLLLENTAGGGDTIGRTFREIGTIITRVGSRRLDVCLDTAHALASGYDVATAKGVAEAEWAFRKHIGADRLTLVHANDSKVPRGSNVDRHENIGDGKIGNEGFRALVRSSLFSAVPWILEVPGLEGKGPDEENIQRLRSLLDN